ncbi:hypothetical protein QR680_004410 [Steinernema hermaphroditum]|uniref:VM domain-containing protein n=1 Tax=Steinernema hermaphroditum TaxID=289476 RepID=A0AA39LT52_9BILA|nr:hypothetical protein QR680_004410 [Steinernema hermaphroditum]
MHLSFALLFALFGAVAATFFHQTLPCGCAPPPPPPCLCAPPPAPLPCAGGCAAAAAPALLPPPAIPVHPCGVAVGGCGGSAALYAHPINHLPPGYIIVRRTHRKRFE